MDINLELYKIFITVADNGSFSKAAETMYISQPAITYQIKKLEEILDTTLFIRTKKGIRLTYEGKILYKYIKEGITSFNNGHMTLKNLKNLDTGIIRIGASTTVSNNVLITYLKIFHEKYPNIEIKIVNNLTSNLLSELKKGNLDLLVLNMPMEVTNDIKVINIKKVQDIFIGDKKYYELTNGKLNLNELSDYPLIFQKSPSNTREFLNEYLQDNNVSLTPKTEVVSYNLIMNLVKIGFGIGYATKEFIKKELKEKELYEIKVSPNIPKRNIGIAMLKNNIPNYSTKKLIDIITKNNC